MRKIGFKGKGDAAKRGEGLFRGIFMQGSLRAVRAFVLLAGFFLCAACSFPPFSDDVPENANLTTHSYAPAERSFTLSPGDVLQIKVFGDEDFSSEYKVDRRGIITMPLIGEVNTVGMTSGTLQKVVERKLAAGYLVNPRVSVEITSFRPFYILGEVQNPGSYPYSPSLDVFKAIALAGGTTPRAVKDEFIIMRDVGAEKRRFEATEDTPVHPGDSIRVKERFF